MTPQPIFMPPALFKAVAQEWPRSYIEGACYDAQYGMTNDMLLHRFLWMRGERVPVVFSDASPLGTTVQGVVATLTRLHERNEDVA